MISTSIKNLAQLGLGGGTASVALLLPKCPLCLAAWASGLSLLGVDVAVYEQFRWPTIVALITLGVLAIGVRSSIFGRVSLVTGLAVLLAGKMTAEGAFAFSGLLLSLAPAILGLVLIPRELKRCQVKRSNIEVNRPSIS